MKIFKNHNFDHGNGIVAISKTPNDKTGKVTCWMRKNFNTGWQYKYSENSRRKVIQILKENYILGEKISIINMSLQYDVWFIASKKEICF